MRREPTILSQDEDRIRIAELIFGRDNGSMINLLKMRGTAIAQ